MAFLRPWRDYETVLKWEATSLPLDLTVILSGPEGSVRHQKDKSQKPKGKKQTKPNQTNNTKADNKGFPVFVLEMVNRCFSDPLRNGLKL